MTTASTGDLLPSRGCCSRRVRVIAADVKKECVASVAEQRAWVKAKAAHRRELAAALEQQKQQAMVAGDDDGDGKDGAGARDNVDDLRSRPNKVVQITVCTLNIPTFILPDYTYLPTHTIVPRADTHYVQYDLPGHNG